MSKLTCHRCGKGLGLAATSIRAELATYIFCSERCKMAWYHDWRARVEDALKEVRARSKPGS